MSKNNKSSPVKIAINLILSIMTLLLLLGLMILVAMLWINDKPYGYANLFHFTIRRLVATGMLVVFITVFAFSLRGILRSRNQLQVKLMLLSVLLLFFVPFIPVARSRWISTQSLRIQKIAPYAPTIEPAVQEDGSIIYHVTEGKIPFKDGGWVYIVTHSSHDDSAMFGTIGDISLAMNNLGEFFYSLDHVCGTLLIDTESKDGVLSFENLNTLIEWTKLVDGKVHERRGSRVWSEHSTLTTNPPPWGAAGSE